MLIMTKNNYRVAFLDGIRGWSALVVLLVHLLFYIAPWFPPNAQYQQTSIQLVKNYDFFTFIAFTIIRFFSDGHLAVFIFFTLSGYALSVHQLNPEKRHLALATSSRYFRLMLPVLCISILAYLLLKFHFFYNLEAANLLSPPSTWLGSFYNFEPSLPNVLRFSLYDVFFHYQDISSYNSSLLTMQVELAGSFLIFLFLGIFRESKKTNWIVIAILSIHLFFSSPPLASFMFGYAIAELNLIYLPSNEKYKNVNLIAILLFYYYRYHVDLISRKR